jgi:hypothetical protein
MGRHSRRRQQPASVEIHIAIETDGLASNTVGIPARHQPTQSALPLAWVVGHTIGVPSLEQSPCTLQIALAQRFERAVGILGSNPSLLQRPCRPLTPQTPAFGIPSNRCCHFHVIEISEVTNPLDRGRHHFGGMLSLQQPSAQFRLAARASRQCPAGRVIRPLFGFLAIARWALWLALFSPHGNRFNRLAAGEKRPQKKGRLLRDDPSCSGSPSTDGFEIAESP